MSFVRLQANVTHDAGPFAYPSAVLFLPITGRVQCGEKLRRPPVDIVLEYLRSQPLHM